MRLLSLLQFAFALFILPWGVHAQSIVVTGDNLSSFLFIGGSLRLACYTDEALIGTLSKRKLLVGAQFKAFDPAAKLRALKGRIKKAKAALRRSVLPALRRKALSKQIIRLSQTVRKLTVASATCRQFSSGNSSSSAGNSISNGSASSSSNLPPGSCTQISQYGITWIFDKGYQCGQFVNGDWWVVGPVTIRNITKPSNMPERDGSMINPIPSTSQHGYDGRVASYESGLDVSTRLPDLIVAAGSSLVSTVSRVPEELDRNKRRPALEVAAVLTVVSSVPAPESFRPPYAGTDKPNYLINSLQTQLLRSLEPVPNTPALSTVENMFEKPWIDNLLEWQGDDLHPAQNMPNYGAAMADRAHDAALRLILNDSLEAKRTLLIRYVQLGIDNYGLVANGANWGVVGGTIGVGRKLPILFAGLMLNDSEMKNVAFNFDTEQIFQEDGQTFYLTQAERNATYNPENCQAGADYCYPGYYDDIPLGIACWGERHHRWETTNYKYLPGKVGYSESTYGSTLGAALAVHLLGITALWNHTEFLDWIDLCWSQGKPGGYNSAFALSMWAQYRSHY